MKEGALESLVNVVAGAPFGCSGHGKPLSLISLPLF